MKFPPRSRPNHLKLAALLPGCGGTGTTSPLSRAYTYACATDSNNVNRPNGVAVNRSGKNVLPSSFRTPLPTCTTSDQYTPFDNGSVASPTCANVPPRGLACTPETLLSRNVPTKACSRTPAQPDQPSAPSAPAAGSPAQEAPRQSCCRPPCSQ